MRGQFASLDTTKFTSQSKGYMTLKFNKYLEETPFGYAEDQDTYCLSWNPKIDYRLYNNPPHVPETTECNSHPHALFILIAYWGVESKLGPLSISF
jgi:hypothetical protein